MLSDNAPTPGEMIDHLATRAMAADHLAELCFSIANDSFSLLPYRQALVFEATHNGERLRCISGLARPGEDSPYVLWLNRAWPFIVSRLPAEPGWLSCQEPPEDWPDWLCEGWREWWPAGLLSVPLRRRGGDVLGRVIFLLDTPPEVIQREALARVRLTWAYCWEMLAGAPQRQWRQQAGEWLTKRRKWLLLALAALVLCPVRQSALAPGEVVAMSSSIVASPLDGVVKQVHVEPNQAVKAGDLLFSLDDTTLRNRLEIARKSTAVADAELLAMTQKSFDSQQSKGELSGLTGRAYERRAELAAVQSQLERIEVRAAANGIAVFGERDDWLGRPVVVGERVMLLADPATPGILVHLPVADAIALDIGSPVRLFLNTTPLSPLDGKLVETSYQATLSPSSGVASYRLRAALDEPDARARIGLRGTAKVYGNWVPLGFYLLRRPLASLREWTGW